MNKLKQNINPKVFSLLLRRVGVLAKTFERKFTRTSFGMAAVAMMGLGWIPATEADAILQVDISDPSNVTFTATISTPDTVSTLPMAAGFTINDFFTSMSTNIGAGTPITGDLKPGQPLNQDTYNLIGTFNFSANTGDFEPGDDLRIYSGGSGTQTFDPSRGRQALSGTATTDLSAVAASLPAPGASGILYTGYFQSGTNEHGEVIGSWEVFGVVSNQPPTAVAGPDQAIRVGDLVNLDGSGSFDDNTAPAALGYAWSLSSPGGSTATLTGSNSATPSFVADVAGTYTAQLIVTDEGGLVSDADQVEISSDNLAPTADAGADQLVIVGTSVSLDGTGSSDPETDPLTFSWAITSAPASSAATLSDASSDMPSFVPDLEGVYEVTLTVSDFIGPGAPDTVAITATTAEGFADNLIVQASNLAASLTAAQVTTVGNQNAFVNFLSQAIVAIQKDPPNLAQAINKLEDALTRTDGCVLRGSPDANGPGNDWFTDCAEQSEIYSLLDGALNALTP